MDEMTDKQYDDNKKNLILLIIELVKHSGSVEEAVKKIEAPLEK